MTRDGRNAFALPVLTVQTWQWDLEWGLPVILLIVLAAVVWANVKSRR